MSDRPRREGFALLLAILAVVLVGALIVATHSAVNLEHFTAASAVNRQRAFAASEHALWYSVANWNAADSTLPPGDAMARVIHAAGDSAIITTVRLNAEVYWLVADASVGDPMRGARRRTAINVRATSDSAGTQVAPVRRSWVEVH